MFEMINDHEIKVNNKTVVFSQKIKNLIEVSSTAIVLLLEETYEENNVRAFNDKAEEIWKINDILKVKKPSGFDEIEKKTDTILQAYCINGIMYEIDVSNKRVLNRTILR